MLGLIYFGIGRAMLPKIQSTVDARDKRIADDLAAAQAARAEADETEEAYRAADGREPRRGAEGDASGQGRQRAKATEERIAKARRGDPGQGREGRSAIRAAADAALAEIESVAAEAAQDMVEQGRRASGRHATRRPRR